MTSDKTPSEAATNYATKGVKSLFHTRVSAYLAGDTNGYSRGKAEGDSNGYQRGKAEAEKRIWEAIAAWTGDPEMPVPLGQLTQEVKQIIFGGGDE